MGIYNPNNLNFSINGKLEEKSEANNYPILKELSLSSKNIDITDGHNGTILNFSLDENKLTPYDNLFFTFAKKELHQDDQNYGLYTNLNTNTSVSIN